jgi:CRISPR-associated endoribonuclease Cas6
MNYLKLTFEIISDKKPYLFIGSKIRGMLGYSLKDVVCINPSFNCKDCFAQKDCIFYKFYEEQNITHKYRLDFKLYNDKYKFSILLFEEAIAYKDIIKEAVFHSLNEYPNIKYKEKKKRLKVKDNFSSIIKIEFLTPLRMKKMNKFILNENELNINDILLSINRRGYELKNLPFQRIKFNQNIKTISKKLKYKEVIRRSNTNRTGKMGMGGLMGEMVLSNIDRATFNLLKLGEVIGVGKSTVFGLGKIKIEEIISY